MRVKIIKNHVNIVIFLAKKLVIAGEVLTNVTLSYIINVVCPFVRKKTKGHRFLILNVR